MKSVAGLFQNNVEAPPVGLEPTAGGDFSRKTPFFLFFAT
jgi:hypothetical protein